MLDALKSEVCSANRDLERLGLVTLTWGNVSGIDRDAGLVVIKPSGVRYADLAPENLVVVDLDGTRVEGALNPSSDMPTHLALYRAFAEIGGVAHTHSPYATMFAQAGRPIPCLGTTHADHFFGPVPVTRTLTPTETAADYESHMAKSIIDRLAGTDPLQMPAVLAANHGPFTWGRTAREALENTVALESVAVMAFGTLALDPETGPIDDTLLRRHFFRKHGNDAYYGQAKPH